MIYTVTLNPAIDYVVRLSDFAISTTNRSWSEELYFGGKGINVSIVLRELGLPSIALGFIAGDTGEMLEKAISDKKIKTDFIKLSSGNTRINVKIKSENESEINAVGPKVHKAELEALEKQLDRIVSGDILVLSGRLPQGVSCDFYEKVAEKMYKKGVITIIDTSEKSLLSSLKFRPFLIKPNTDELSELMEKSLEKEDDIIAAAIKLQNMGAMNVLVSRGSNGALLLDQEGEVHCVSAHKGRSVNSVGAGDSMVAGFIYGYLNKMPYKEILHFANACGAATAFSADIAKREDIFKLIENK